MRTLAVLACAVMMAFSSAASAQEEVLEAKISFIGKFARQFPGKCSYLGSTHVCFKQDIDGQHLSFAFHVSVQGAQATHTCLALYKFSRQNPTKKLGCPVNVVTEKLEGIANSRTEESFSEQIDAIWLLIVTMHARSSDI